MNLKLKFFILSHGLTQEDVSREAFVSSRTLRNWIKGEVEPNKLAMRDVLKALERLTGKKVTPKEIGFENYC